MDRVPHRAGGVYDFGERPDRRNPSRILSDHDVVFVEPEEFLAILRKSEKGVVVYSPSGFLSKHKYLTSYKGLTFFTKSKEALTIFGSAEVITAKKIIVPEM